MGFIDESVLKYINEIQPLCEGELGEIQKLAYKENVPIIHNDVVRLLSFILSVKRPKFILEIGAAIGFSSALMSKYLKDGGFIDTIDRFDIMIEHFKENREKLGLTEKINLIEGDAADILPKLDKKYDVIFLDGAKGQYIQFLPHCIRLLNVGGILIADDILQGGAIACDRFSVVRRQRTIHTRMRKFLNEICNNDILETSILTIGDGVALCYKKKEE